MSKESQSTSYSDNPEFLFTHVDASSNKRHPNETFDPTVILDDHRNCVLYSIWKEAPAGMFKTLAVDFIKREPTVVETLEKAGLLPDYFAYCIQYMLEVRKWVPKGVRQ